MFHRTTEPASAPIGQASAKAASPAKLRKRRSEIIRELSDLSRDGWSRARFDDYAPLNAELDRINERLQGAGQ